jgi:hypothetical protein
MMPTIHGFMDPFYRPPLVLSIIAVSFLLVGFAAPSFLHSAQTSAALRPFLRSEVFLKPRRAVPWGIVLLVILYGYVSLSNGLWNRRQGSELMAEIYGTLPLVEITILRVYEILFIPIAVIYLFGETSKLSKFIVVFCLIASLPFMGIEDSRGRILVISICLLSFVKISNFRSFFENNFKIYGFMFFAIGAFFYVSAQRLTRYNRTEDYFFNEIVRRLDGLYLVSELRDSGHIKYLGHFDFDMLAPLVSRIPFIEAGRLAKIEGLTSTKQYFLKSILQTNRIDESNSIILDPLYFGGVIGMAISFVVLGYFIGADKLLWVWISAMGYISDFR